MIDGGTAAAALLLDKDTMAPPVGAGPLKVTVPVEDVKLATLVGLTETAERATVAIGVMVSAVVVIALL